MEGRTRSRDHDRAEAEHDDDEAEAEHEHDKRQAAARHQHRPEVTSGLTPPTRFTAIFASCRDIKPLPKLNECRIYVTPEAINSQ